MSEKLCKLKKTNSGGGSTTADVFHAFSYDTGNITNHTIREIDISSYKTVKLSSWYLNLGNGGALIILIDGVQKANGEYDITNNSTLTVYSYSTVSSGVWRLAYDVICAFDGVNLI